MQLTRHILRLTHSPLLFNADTGAEPSGGNNAPPPPETPPKPNSDPTAELIARILNTKRVNGDANEALNVLAGQVGRLETALAQEKSRGAQIPADVQSKADWVDELGGLDKAKSALESGRAFAAEATVARRDKAVRLAGFDPENFAALALAGEYEYEVKTEKVDDKTVEVGYAKRTVNGQVESKRIADVVSERAPSLADSLKIAPLSPVRSGREFVKQGVGGTKPNLFDGVRENARADYEKGKPSSIEPEALRRAGLN